MFKKLLMIFFICSFAHAQVLSGHQEFVHYSSEQKKEFIIQVMELMVELESQYEKAPLDSKRKYSLLLEQLKKLLINSAHAAETNVSVFANDLTSLLDPNITSGKRCIYAGWVSQTISTAVKSVGMREICQHPKYIRNMSNSAESKAYNKSSSCGKKDQNTISCNPAIFGFKKQATGEQFCVPAGISNSENSSYACMQKSLGLTHEEGADPKEKRIEYLKKQFEGNPALVNNLFGFIYKTCLCDTQETEVINQSYLNRTRPHRTCLGLVNTIAETNHCVEFSTVKSSEMELFKGIRSFTNDIAGKAKNGAVDTQYRKLLNNLKTQFSDDYALICEGKLPPPSEEPEKDNENVNQCVGECDLVDGKWSECVFKNGEETLDLSPPEDNSTEFTTKINEQDILCKINERTINHQTSCQLVVSEDKVSLKMVQPEGVSVKLVSTEWKPAQTDALAQEASFGKEEEISLKINIEVKGKQFNIECGSAKNPKEDDAPKIHLDSDGGDANTQKLTTRVEPDDTEGWTYEWSRTRPKKEEEPETKIQGDSDDEESEEKPQEDESNEVLQHKDKDYSAPKEDEPYQVCVQLVKEGKKPSNRPCHTIDKKEEKKDSTEVAPQPNVGGPQLPQIQQPLRRGVNFSRGGVL